MSARRGEPYNRAPPPRAALRGAQVHGVEGTEGIERIALHKPILQVPPSFPANRRCMLSWPCRPAPPDLRIAWYLALPMLPAPLARPVPSRFASAHAIAPPRRRGHPRRAGGPGAGGPVGAAAG